ncbi:aminotransferase-like domain-containing protein [Chryseobacterium luquanense]|uniref:PLP-dependent aminotransferase family protein n=1 Tax=Chryseobacterium luquanense TaxID=2983766 RepID=A0ABT3Y7E4_9FLAO|nr:PLP-dependent aminotransferase family protein [Chryseobacterium luquanense]MCX8534089.1 PLP-dependent aminotransferase family protein [Chryseobacterium luquanense]
MFSYKYEIFTAVIENKINKRVLLKGERLPSIREIKKEYNLSVVSVQSGYESLVLKGLVKSIPKKGYFVDKSFEKQIPISKKQFSPVSRDIDFTSNLQLTSARNKSSEANSFNNAVPGDSMIPQKLILRTMQNIIREKGASLLRYYPPNGSEELRNLISDRMRRVGSFINPDEIIITDGALQALFIALRSVTNEGDVIAIESPCVFSVLEVAATLNLKIIEIPVQYENGFDINYFEKVCLEHTIKALVITPNFHNPTGKLMNDLDKKNLLNISEKFKIPIIENDIYGDLYFTEERPSCLKNFDEHNSVITFSSFSKSLAPGIRLGWLHAGKFYQEAEKIKFSLGRTVSPLYQELIIKILQNNSYYRHLRSFRKKLNQQAMYLWSALKKHFPENSYFHQPEGGYSIWCELPEEINMKEFYNYCERNKILFTPGITFSITDEYQHCFRAVFADYLTSESLILIEKAGVKARELLLK